MTPYHKLVRDAIPKILDAKGIQYEKKVATLDEFKVALMTKLVEEVNEFIASKNAEEIADILEVIDALQTFPEYREVKELQRKKRATRGGFSQRIILKGEKE